MEDEKEQGLSTVLSGKQKAILRALRYWRSTDTFNRDLVKRLG